MRRLLTPNSSNPFSLHAGRRNLMLIMLIVLKITQHTAMVISKDLTVERSPAARSAERRVMASAVAARHRAVTRWRSISTTHTQRHFAEHQSEQHHAHAP